MTKPLSSLADLKALRAGLAEREQARLRDQQVKDAAAAQALRESQLFQAFVTDVEPLKPHGRHAVSTAKPEPVARQFEQSELAALVESLSDDFDAETLLDTDDAMSWARSGIGHDIVRKLRRGHWVIQDEIDLHGARTEEARSLVSMFVRESVKRGLRCVRIVHGKGLGSVARQPVLKGKVRSWLMQKEEVLAFCFARAHDGGTGALIVLLRPR